TKRGKIFGRQCRRGGELLRADVARRRRVFPGRSESPRFRRAVGTSLPAAGGTDEGAILAGLPGRAARIAGRRRSDARDVGRGDGTGNGNEREPGRGSRLSGYTLSASVGPIVWNRGGTQSGLMREPLCKSFHQTVDRAIESSYG